MLYTFLTHLNKVFLRSTTIANLYINLVSIAQFSPSSCFDLFRALQTAPLITPAAPAEALLKQEWALILDYDHSESTILVLIQLDIERIWRAMKNASVNKHHQQNWLSTTNQTLISVWLMLVNRIPSLKQYILCQITHVSSKLLLLQEVGACWASPGNHPLFVCSLARKTVCLWLINTENEDLWWSEPRLNYTPGIICLVK